jgi:hypothetical protein
MTKQEAFQKMEILLPLIVQYYNTASLTLDVENQMVLKDVWENFLFTSGQLNLGCNSCVTYALDTVYSYYEREHPKYLSALIPKEEEKVEEPIIEPKPKKKNNGKL